MEHVKRIMALLAELDESATAMEWIKEITRYILHVMDVEPKEVYDLAKMLPERKREAAMSTAEQLIQQGIQQGIQEGIQQGFYKGLLEDSREAVIEALEVKFGEVKPHISQRIKRIENRDVLKALLKAAIKANSLEEFEQKLKAQAN